MEDEINLMDYVKVILKRKLLILIIFLVAVLAAGVYSFLATKIYEIDTSLEIGRIGKETLEAPTQLVEKINSGVYNAAIKEKLSLKGFPGIIASSPKGTSLVLIEMESSQPQEAKNVLASLNELVLEDHQEKIKTKKELLEEDIERQKTKVVSLEKEKETLEEKVNALQKTLVYDQTPGTQFALFDTKEKLEGKIQEIENLYLRINSQERALEDYEPTKVIKNPLISSGPIKPKIKLNILVAAVLGLFVGVLAAFGKEWYTAELTRNKTQN